MNIFDELKSLVTHGPARAPVPAPAVVEPPAVLPEPSPTADDPVVASSVPASSQEAIELDDLGHDFRRPVDPVEEERIDLPQRSRQRIRFLLDTYEKDRPDLTQKRIQNDRARYLMAKPAPKNTDRKPNRNPQAHVISPDAETPSVGTWRV
jgi:hypothetical protein